jgi:hypothetical protein
VNGNRNCPMLYQNDGKRKLGLNWVDFDFLSNARLLVVRKYIFFSSLFLAGSFL